jgi:hypothetical protein
MSAPSSRRSMRFPQRLSTQSSFDTPAPHSFFGWHTLFPGPVSTPGLNLFILYRDAAAEYTAVLP